MSIHKNPLGVGLFTGLGLCLGLAGQARAGSYGHAEITLGFPNAAITVGKTWETGPREVVVEQVTHKYPDYDDDDEATVVQDDRDYDDEDEDVVIEQRVRPRKVIVVRDEPRYCDRVHVVRRVYVDPCPRRDVVVYHEPERVIYTPSCRRVVVDPPRVVVAPSRCDRVIYRGGGEVHGGGHGYGRGDHGGYQERGGYGPKNLFPEDGHNNNGGGRPMRMRGVQQVALGGRSH